MYDLRDLITPGRSAKVHHLVRESDAAVSYSSGLEELMSTPAIIALAIQASVEAIDSYLPEGFISIGRSVEFEHTAPTRVGMEVTVEATVAEVQPLFVVLEIRASDDSGEVGFGRHRRSIVAQDYFLAGSRKRADLSTNSRTVN